MARAGVYLWDVKRARDALLASGRNPSIDAVRAELGNTGSKTTIHKYLRELEVEERNAGASVSDAILALVSQLAGQLQADAAVAIDAVRTQWAIERTEQEQTAAGLNTQLASVVSELESLSQQLESAQQQLAAAQQILQQEQLARHAAEQRGKDLSERLAVAERHQASLEEKHKHARDTLEHFRTASKEQRDQEARRHEHQVHVVQNELRQAQQAAALKQEQLTQLNREAAALAADLAANKQAIYLEKEVSRRLQHKVEQLQAIEAHAATLESQAADARARSREAEATAAAALETCGELRQQNAGLEARLASIGQASIMAQHITELQRAVFGAGTSGADTVNKTSDSAS